MELRAEYSYDADVVSLESGLSCPEGDDLTKQAFKAECDINTIVRRFGLTGEMPQAPRLPTFADFSEVGDFHSALEAVRSAEEAFMELPAEVRKRFENDAGAFVAFCSDDKNRPEAIKLGLVKASAAELELELAGKAKKAADEADSTRIT